jgi:hypothetical protein
LHEYRDTIIDWLKQPVEFNKCEAEKRLEAEKKRWQIHPAHASEDPDPVWFRECMGLGEGRRGFEI